MFSQSKTWISPEVEEARNKQRLNSHRKKLCPQSPFWTLDFDLRKHKAEWDASLRRLEERKARCKQQESHLLSSLNARDITAILPALHGKLFSTHRSVVLALPTVFTRHFGRRCMAPWPTRDEMKYEGDDRIATDRLHGRFLPAPRVGSDNTVTWMQRPIIWQEALENFHAYPSEVDIFFRTHWVAELELTDEEGRSLLGSELMDLLDPTDVY